MSALHLDGEGSPAVAAEPPAHTSSTRQRGTDHKGPTPPRGSHQSEPELRAANADLADLIVAGLEALGVRRVYLCPGSRSTPLVFALHRAGLATEVILDERSAGYALVGAARAGTLAAVVTTSGTAVANLVPGLVEADVDQLPVVVVSADRPHRLTGRGANQTIRQPPLLAPLMRRQLDLDVDALAESLLHEVTIPALRALGEALTGPHRGPVHLNVRFDKPLEPAPGRVRRHFQISPIEEVSRSRGSHGALEAGLQQARRGLVVVGALPSSHHRAALAFLHRAVAAGWPVILDPVSGLAPAALRPEVGVGVGVGIDVDVDVGVEQAGNAPIILSPHLARLPQLAAHLIPDVVLWLGGRTTEDDVAAFLQRQRAAHGTRVLQWRAGAAVVDPEGLMSLSIVAGLEGPGTADDLDEGDPDAPENAPENKPENDTRKEADTQAGLRRVKALPPSGLSDDARRVAAVVAAAMASLGIGGGGDDDANGAGRRSALAHAPPPTNDAPAGAAPSAGLDEIGVARTVVAAAGAAATWPILFVGNSMPMRDVARFTQLPRGVRLIANRGASGIDGNFGTALGAARAVDAPLWALLGDLSALHDLSGLAVLAHAARAPGGDRLVGRLVVVNNEGGGIFTFLPVASSGLDVDVVTRAFLTPHHFRLAEVAAALGLRTVTVATIDALKTALLDDTEDLALIEVCTDKDDNKRRHRAIDAALDAALDASTPVTTSLPEGGEQP